MQPAGEFWARFAAFLFVIGLVSGADAAKPAAGEFDKKLLPVSSALRLDSALTEISGLAPDGEGRVYAHNDELGTVYVLDIETGKILRRMTLGRPAVTGDFEAIVADGDAVALITSKGLIYEARLPARGEVMTYEVIDTKVGRECEIEGFAPADDAKSYFITCKNAKSRFVVYNWSKNGGARKVIDLKLAGVVPNPKEFCTADIVIDRETGAFLALDSEKGAILEVSADGKLVDYWRLAGDHPQAEGLAIMPDGGLLVADETKRRDGPASGGLLTRYPAR